MKRGLVLSKKRAIQIILFVLYTFFVVWVTLLKREPRVNRIFRPELFWAFRTWIAGGYNGKAESIQYIMNILFFIPYGFLFPWKKNWKFVLITSAVTSVVVELTQYVFILGECEIDDVISNTLGAMIGFGLFLVTRKLFNQIVGKKYKEEERMNRKQGIYEKYMKRVFDIICALLAIVVFCWLYAIIAVLVRVKLGSPVLFKQPRPGKIDPKTGREKIFYMYKFRSMSDERDENGNFLPDDVRLGKFGKALRATSLDELPEAFNILKGDMSIIGPRPQLVRDMVFMTDEQRMRHTAKPGLSGLAQVNGRNDITWEEKLDWDLNYIEKVSFLGDVKIIFQTVMKAFVKQEGITDGDLATAYDYGDWLLKEGKVSKEEYIKKQDKAKELLGSVKNGKV